ncbi:MAG TPA: GNAT family N-acetyltransferase [Ignavibacteriaceae bacterium]|nr:GNAT family N-acetyltransferase [Ignavibacteriaceae bacterium]
MNIDIKHDEEKKKFFSIVDGKEARLEYEIIDDKTIEFPFTYVPQSLRGKGIAAKLVEYGLEYARSKNLSVIASCSYVENFIQRNQKYKNLVT